MNRSMCMSKHRLQVPISEKRRHPALHLSARMPSSLVSEWKMGQWVNHIDKQRNISNYLDSKIKFR